MNTEGRYRGLRPQAAAGVRQRKLLAVFGVVAAGLAGTIGPASAAPSTASGDQSSPRSNPAPPHITGVTFQGSSRDPVVILRGANFGSRPEPYPRRGTSNLGFCGPIPGRTGDDFGSKLWLEDETQRWSAGYSGYVDCIGLIVESYRHTEVEYRLGSWYALHFAQRNRFPHGVYALREGDFVNLKLGGVNIGTRVHYSPRPHH